MFAEASANPGVVLPLKEQLKNGRALFKTMFPGYLIKGPYATSAKVMLGISFVSLAGLRLHISKNYDKEGYQLHMKKDMIIKNPKTIEKIKLIASIYGFAVLFALYKFQGVFPFASYTVQSWSMTTLRFLMGYLALKTNSKIFKDLEEILRFPSLAQNTVTFSVWWFILFPIITASLALRKQPVGSKLTGAQAAMQFVKWNASPMLLTLHGVNLPFAFLGHFLEPRKLTVLDIYHGLASGLIYLSFYLSVLDKNGIPLYIILSPRSMVGSVSYASIFSFYFLIWRAVDKMTPEMAPKLKPFFEKLAKIL